jgi:hypothetical protein
MRKNVGRVTAYFNVSVQRENEDKHMSCIKTVGNHAKLAAANPFLEKVLLYSTSQLIWDIF